MEKCNRGSKKHHNGRLWCFYVLSAPHGIGDVGEELVQFLESHLVCLENAAQIILLVDAIDLHRIVFGIYGEGLGDRRRSILGWTLSLLVKFINTLPSGWIWIKKKASTFVDALVETTELESVTFRV